MNKVARTMTIFAVGLGIGAAVALLFAPQSGEETREWIAHTAKRKAKFLRRKGQESIEHLQDAVALGGEKVSKVLKSGKNALDSVTAKLA